MLDKPSKAAVAPGLKTYRDKRDFKKTPEPIGKVSKASGRQFVVQKHDARRLHFDLRLELNGVLKSWAVTKGPSLIAGTKRLAVETEDHPLGYLEWEGVIPEGEYGGGTMIVWDRGIWEPLGDAVKGLSKGHLQFMLSGKRLKGLWDLVRMSRRNGEKKDSWILIKRTDEYAIASVHDEPVQTENTSVLSNKSNQDLAAGKKLRPDHAARHIIKKATTSALSDLSRLAGAKKGILPVFVEPCLATLAEAPPEGDDWLHEIKFDGYRMQARLDGGKVQLLTRNGMDWTKRFTSIANALKVLPLSSGLLDGELCVQDEIGITSFNDLQTDLRARRQERLVYIIFDILYCEGVDIRGAGLIDRKIALKEAMAGLTQGSPLGYSEHLEIPGNDLLAHACRLGLEGIVSKKSSAKYASGRGSNWVKSKCNLRQEFIVIGYLASSSLRQAIGSLALGYYEKGKLVYVGRVGTGFSNQLSHDLYRSLQLREAAQPKFRTPLAVADSRNVKWVKPELVAEIEYRGWSSEGLLRHASFKGLREDKKAAEVQLEQQKVEGLAQRNLSAEYRLTHPDRVLWEDKGITKERLAEFYVDISDRILPHIINRPLSLVKCPKGAGAKCFYTKHVWKGADPALQSVSTGEGEPVRLQHSWDRMHDLKIGGFLAHRSPLENEDETEIRTPGSDFGAECQRHPPRNTQAPRC